MITIPKEEWEQMREELRELRKAVNDLTTALSGNNLGTSGIVSRVFSLEEWRSEAKLKLALIAAGIAGASTGVLEAVKHFFANGGHEK